MPKLNELPQDYYFYRMVIPEIGKKLYQEKQKTSVASPASSVVISPLKLINEQWGPGGSTPDEETIQQSLDRLKIKIASEDLTQILARLENTLIESQKFLDSKYADEKTNIKEIFKNRLGINGETAILYNNLSQHFSRQYNRWLEANNVGDSEEENNAMKQLLALYRTMQEFCTYMIGLNELNINDCTAKLHKFPPKTNTEIGCVGGTFTRIADVNAEFLLEKQSNPSIAVVNDAYNAVKIQMAEELSPIVGQGNEIHLLPFIDYIFCFYENQDDPHYDLPLYYLNLPQVINVIMQMPQRLQITIEETVKAEKDADKKEDILKGLKDLYSIITPVPIKEYEEVQENVERLDQLIGKINLLISDTRMQPDTRSKLENNLKLGIQKIFGNNVPTPKTQEDWKNTLKNLAEKQQEQLSFINGPKSINPYAQADLDVLEVMLKGKNPYLKLVAFDILWFMFSSHSMFYEDGTHCPIRGESAASIFYILSRLNDNFDLKTFNASLPSNYTTRFTEFNNSKDYVLNSEHYNQFYHKDHGYYHSIKNAFNLPDNQLTQLMITKYGLDTDISKAIKSCKKNNISFNLDEEHIPRIFVRPNAYEIIKAFKDNHMSILTNYRILETLLENKMEEQAASLIKEHYEFLPVTHYDILNLMGCAINNKCAKFLNQLSSSLCNSTIPSSIHIDYNLVKEFSDNKLFIDFVTDLNNGQKISDQAFLTIFFHISPSTQAIENFKKIAGKILEKVGGFKSYIKNDYGLSSLHSHEPILMLLKYGVIDINSPGNRYLDRIISSYGSVTLLNLLISITKLENSSVNHLDFSVADAFGQTPLNYMSSFKIDLLNSNQMFYKLEFPYVNFFKYVIEQSYEKPEILKLLLAKIDKDYFQIALFSADIPADKFKLLETFIPDWKNNKTYYFFKLAVLTKNHELLKYTETTYNEKLFDSTNPAIPSLNFKMLIETGYTLELFNFLKDTSYGHDDVMLNYITKNIFTLHKDNPEILPVLTKFTDSSNQSLFEKLIREAIEGKLDISELLSKYPSLTGHTDSSNKTLYQCAIENNADIKIIAAILSYSINDCDIESIKLYSNMNHLCHFACSTSNINLIYNLVKVEPRMFYNKDENGKLPSQVSTFESLCQLIVDGISIDHFILIGEGLVYELLKKRDSNGNTLAHLVAQSDNPFLLVNLYMSGADLTQKNSDNRTVIDCLPTETHAIVFEWLYLNAISYEDTNLINELKSSKIHVESVNIANHNLDNGTNLRLFTKEPLLLTNDDNFMLFQNIANTIAGDKESAPFLNNFIINCLKYNLKDPILVLFDAGMDFTYSTEKTESPIQILIKGNQNNLLFKILEKAKDTNNRPLLEHIAFETVKCGNMGMLVKLDNIGILKSFDLSELRNTANTHEPDPKHCLNYLNKLIMGEKKLTRTAPNWGDTVKGKRNDQKPLLLDKLCELMNIAEGKEKPFKSILTEQLKLDKNLILRDPAKLSDLANLLSSNGINNETDFTKFRLKIKDKFQLTEKVNSLANELASIDRAASI